MYRDSAQSLDEHDRVVGAILIGEALTDNCDRAAKRVDFEATPAHDRWRAVHEVHDAYPEIWRHLDRARRELAQRGANTIAYDELRPTVKRAATDSEAKIDSDALDEAKRAIAELKLAVPGADWKAIAARTAGLVHLPLGNKRSNQRLLVGAVVAMFLLALLSWLIAIIPEHKPTRHETLRRELAGITSERRSRIDFLHAELGGDRCIPWAAQDLARLLVLDGRTSDAREFGASYISRCGSDSAVEHWAKAPRPGH